MSLLQLLLWLSISTTVDSLERYQAARSGIVDDVVYDDRRPDP
jgi:hypothetical protein